MNPSRAPRIWSSLAAILTLALGAPPARAQAQAKAEDKAAAESLFRRALELMDRDQAAEACPLFEEVFRITGGLGAEFELARCYETTGRLASAWATYREVSQRDKGRRAKDALAAAARIEPSLAHLTVEVPSSVATLPGLEVRRDGRPLLRGAWGVSIPVDPGEHRVETSATGMAAWSVLVALAPGGNRTIVVGPLSAGTSPPPAAPATTQPPSSSPARLERRPDLPSTGGRTQQTLGLGLGGLGVVGLGVGVALGLSARAKYNEQRDKEACVDNLCTVEGDKASTEARSQGTLGTVVGGIGLAALIGGFVLYVTAPSPRAPAAGAPAITWQPVFGRGTASLGFALRW